MDFKIKSTASDRYLTLKTDQAQVYCELRNESPAWGASLSQINLKQRVKRR